MAAVARGVFLVGPAYDGVWLIGAPLLGIGAGALAAAAAPVPVLEYGDDATAQALALRTLIHAHLVIVLARSHLNPAVFRRFPGRFVVAPIALLAAMLLSSSVRAVLLSVVIAWDLVHSSLQTFGLARLYERRVDDDPRRGRAVDLWLCHALYLGAFAAGPLFPMVMGAVLAPLTHVVPAAGAAIVAVTDAAPVVAAAARAASLAAVVAFIVHTVGLWRRGAKVSGPKLALYATTALAGVVAWGRDSFGQALLIVNVFHAVQYFALVSHSERHSLATRFGFPARHATALAALTLALIGGLYGFWFGAAWMLWVPAGAGRAVLLSVVNVVALLHFWYDGFLWRVRDGATP